jgi:hypothetical protein
LIVLSKPARTAWRLSVHRDYPLPTEMAEGQCPSALADAGGQADEGGQEKKNLHPFAICWGRGSVRVGHWGLSSCPACALSCCLSDEGAGETATSLLVTFTCSGVIKIKPRHILLCRGSISLSWCAVGRTTTPRKHVQEGTNIPSYRG